MNLNQIDITNFLRTKLISYNSFQYQIDITNLLKIKLIFYNFFNDQFRVLFYKITTYILIYFIFIKILK